MCFDQGVRVLSVGSKKSRSLAVGEAGEGTPKFSVCSMETVKTPSVSPHLTVFIQGPTGDWLLGTGPLVTSGLAPYVPPTGHTPMLSALQPSCLLTTITSSQPLRFSRGRQQPRTQGSHTEGAVGHGLPEIQGGGGRVAILRGE